MNLRKAVAILLVACLVSTCFCACSNNRGVKDPTDDMGTTTNSDDAVSETEARLPMIEGEAVKMYYDDRLPLSDLTDDTAAEAVISEQTVTSHMVGTDSKDMGVLYFSSADRTLIAIGTGTAVVTVGEKHYQVTVEAAPISLFMITGHSLGAGVQGNSKDSVMIAQGKAYSSHGPETAGDNATNRGLGFAAAEKPNGNIYGFSEAGIPGEDSGLAWRWHNLTGEKVWVLNAAVGGTCLPEWVKGQPTYENAVKLFRYAQNILKNEIAAGHYRLKDMAIIYHSAANFGYKQVVFTNDTLKEWYDSMWRGFKTDLATDMDGDGKTETVQSMGLVPIWTPPAAGAAGIHDDKPANYFMAASNSYPDVYMASLIGRGWTNDTGIVKNFPDIPYSATHGEMPVKPQNTADVYADGVHYKQVVYNTVGIEIANNMYSNLRQKTTAGKVTLKKIDGNSVYDKLKMNRVGAEVELLIECDPVNVDDLTITVTDNLTISYPFVVTAVAEGEGKLTVSQGNTVLVEVAITVGK